MVDISVILQTYNHESYLEQAFDSVLSQETDASIELLVAEDCSTDRTREIVLDYASRYPDTIRLFLSERNRNDMQVWLRPYRAARGDYLAYLDGDDYWLPGKLQRQLEFMREHPQCPMCFHAVELHYDDAPPRLRRHTGPWHTMEELLRGNRIGSCSVLVRRSVLGELPDWFSRIDYSDWPLAVLAAEHGPLGYIDEPFGVYRWHAGGMWTAGGARRQADYDVRFLSELVGHVGERHLADAELALASARYRLAKASVEAGDRATATRAALRSLREVPWHRELPTRNRLKVVARSTAPRAYLTLKSLRHHARRATAS